MGEIVESDSLGERLRDTRLRFRSSVIDWEEYALAMPQVEIPVRHFFADGVYAREMRAPAGLIITGLIHRQSQVNVCISGDISIITEEGTRRFTGGEIIVSPAGTKRAAYTHTDTVWLTILGTQLTDADEIERTLTCHRYQELIT